MNIINISDEDDNISMNCTDFDNNIVLQISPLVVIIITLIPGVFSLLCLISFMLNTLIKSLFKKIKKIHTITIIFILIIHICIHVFTPNIHIRIGVIIHTNI